MDDAGDSDAARPCGFSFMIERTKHSLQLSQTAGRAFLRVRPYLRA